MEFEALKALVERGLSTRGIAAEMGKSQATAKHWLKVYSLDTKAKQMRSLTVCRTCGTTDPEAFYAYRKKFCKACDNARVVAKQRKMKDRINAYLGGACSKCGYKKCKNALEVHHLDSSTKDSYFKTVTGWSWPRIEKELVGCVLLCSNCHRETHYPD